MAFLSPAEVARLGLVRPELLSKLTQLMDAFQTRTGHRTVVGPKGGVRSTAEQARIHADSIAQGFRAAPAGSSKHEFGAAFDLIIVGTGRDAAADQRNPLYRTLAELGESLGLDAGFYFSGGRPDPYHFELRESLADARARWESLTKERLRRAGIVVALIIVAALAAYGKVK